MEPAMVILPVLIENKGIQIRSTDQLDELGFRDAAKWMREAEDLWNQHRGSKSNRMSLYESVNYQGKLTNQDISAPYLVLYNASGTDVSAALFARKSCVEPFFVDHKLYYYATRNRAEASYLVALLNSRTVNLLIKPFQSVGLQGERDIHKKVLELPIPLFDDREPEHVALARLGEEARKRAAKVVEEAKGRGWPGGLARRRAIVRQGLKDVLDQIDLAVKRLFGVGD